jgi:hypothetical protein
MRKRRALLKTIIASMIFFLEPQQRADFWQFAAGCFNHSAGIVTKSSKYIEVVS